MTLTTTSELASVFNASRDEVNNLIRYALPELGNPAVNGQPRRLHHLEAIMFGVALELRRLGLPAPVVQAIVLKHMTKFPREELAIITAEDGGCAFYFTSEIGSDLIARYQGRPLLIVPLAPIRAKVKQAMAAAEWRFGEAPKRLPGGWGPAPIPDAVRKAKKAAV